MKIFLDLAARVQALEKIYDELYNLFICIAQGNLKWQVDVSRSMEKKPTCMIKVDSSQHWLHSWPLFRIK